MKYMVSAVCLLALFLPGSPVHGSQVEQAGIYPFIEYFTWKEFDDGRRLLEETGPRIGVGALADVNVDNRALMLRVRGEIFGGEVDYDGRTQSVVLDPDTLARDSTKENRPVKTDVIYFGFRAEGDLGWRNNIGKGTLAPFAGLGYRYWLRSLQDSVARDTNGNLFAVGGYDENWHDFYTKLGLRGDLKVGPEAKLVFEGGGKYPILTRNIVEDLTLKPRGQWSGFAEAGLQVGRFRPAFFYEGYRWNMSPGEPVGHGLVVLQPESRADVFGLNLLILLE